MNKLLTLGIGGWMCLSCLTVAAQAQLASPASSGTADFSTTQRGNVIVIGRQDDYPYVVAVPTREVDTLTVIRRFASDAFLTEAGRGSYVYAGSFSNRTAAENLSRLLRSRGLDARVVHFR